MHLRKTLSLFAIGCVAGLTLGTSVQSGDKKNPAATPSPRMGKDGKADPGWMKRHEGFVEIAKKGDVDVLFLGDSITDGWRGKNGKTAWDKAFGSMKPANFGIGGDRTEHVLWRIQNGELDGIKPKVAVLMIGTNNSGSNSAEQIAEGVTAIVKTLQQKTPETKVLLLAVFPRGSNKTFEFNKQHETVVAVNKIIEKLDDGSKVKYLDIGSKFLKDAKLSKDIMPDALHLSAEGYQIWADAITPTLTTMLGKSSRK
jgi:lysophospholipase L1-like esterase